MLSDEAKQLAKGKNFAALTTLFPDGRPQTNIMWIDADDDHLLINTEVHRAKFKNMSRDDRVSIALMDSTDPYHYVEVRGQVVESELGDRARAHIDELSHKYLGADYSGPIRSERVIVKIAPISEVATGGGR